MPDRESFVAAIAAAPQDDLPRLVFADWLDENGESERAEFIRAQVRRAAEWGGPDDGSLAQTALTAFDSQGVGWCHTFLTALGLDLTGYKLKRSPFWQQTGASALTVDVFDPQYRLSHLVPHLAFRRGFVEELAVTVANAPKACSFAEAFRHEPVHALEAHFGVRTDGKSWSRLSEPALRRINRLKATFHPDAAGMARAVMEPLFDDLHLAGVRQFALSPDPTGDEGVRIPPETLAAFTNSRLAYRLDALELTAIDDDGVRALARDTRLQVSRLSLNGAYTRDALPPLERSGIADTVRALTLFFGEPDDLAAFARTRWPKLTELHLGCHIDDGGTFPPGGLEALAAAEFTPYLEVLDLSGNHMGDGGGGNLDGLRELAAALNPHRLVLLDLQLTGLTAVPDFLANRFGEKVVV